MKRRQFSWYVSVVLYRFTFFELVNQLDEAVFAYLGDGLQDAFVADCGCGPGHLAEKLLDKGAACVVAIDHSTGMLRQLEDRLPRAVQDGRVRPVHSRFTPALFADLLAGMESRRGFDLVVFKRSLYMPAEEALPVLKTGIESLAPGGKLVVIHGERSLRKYAFKPGMKFASYTPYHLVNRIFSRLGHRLGIGEYTLYTKEELVELLRQAAGGRPVDVIPSKQQAYNMAAVTG